MAVGPMWSLRRATTSDRPALVELCHVAVGEDDYVPAYLEDFLRTGVVFLAEERRQAVGMMVYHDIPDGSVWLHAARTHPDYRRRGVATRLMARCEGLARRRHRTAMRLWAAASNLASVAANRQYGYQERARFTRMRILADPARGAVDMTPFRMTTAAWSEIARSSLLHLGAGYFFHDFYFLRLDRASAARLTREGALWRTGTNILSISEDYEAQRGKYLQVQPLSGSLRAVLRACPAIGAARGAERIETFLPHRPRILHIAQGAGFEFMEWGQEAILFEKPIRLTADV